MSWQYFSQPFVFPVRGLPKRDEKISFEDIWCVDIVMWLLVNKKLVTTMKIVYIFRRSFKTQHYLGNIISSIQFQLLVFPLIVSSERWVAMVIDGLATGQLYWRHLKAMSLARGLDNRLETSVDSSEVSAFTKII